MNRKVYLVIITLVTVICIVGGTVYHVGGFFSGRVFSWLSYFESSDVTYEETLSGINNINIDMDAMEVRFEEGDTFSYRYDGPDNLTPFVDVKGDTLSVESHEKINIKSGIDSGDWQFIIYVPKGTSFNNVNINLDFGNIQIKNLNCNNLDIEADAGNIEIYESEFNKTDIEAALGNVETHESKLGESSISCDMGNVLCDNTDINSLDISNDLGNTEVYLNGDEMDYRFELSVDLGSLKVNGKKYSGSYNSGTSGGKPVSIENDMGNITIMCR